LDFIICTDKNSPIPLPLPAIFPAASKPFPYLLVVIIAVVVVESSAPNTLHTLFLWITMLALIHWLLDVSVPAMIAGKIIPSGNPSVSGMKTRLRLKIKRNKQQTFRSFDEKESLEAEAV
jgi:hypothetical protein